MWGRSSETRRFVTILEVEEYARLPREKMVASILEV